MEDITFLELWNEYDTQKMTQLREQSCRKIRSIFKNHILPYFKDYKLKEITHTVYLDWKKQIFEKRKYKNSTKENIYTALVGILNYAVMVGYLDKNIASIMGGFQKKLRENKNVNFWTFEEFKQFISVVDDEEYKLFFNVLYYTGLRLGECIALTWNDFKGTYLDINKTISKEKDSENNYIINSPKTTGSIRRIELDKYIVQSLKEKHKKMKKLPNFSNDWYIFGGQKPFTQTTITRRKDNYCDKAGVKKIRLHDFRHSHATFLISIGTPITVVSQRLGHTDTYMTLNTYTHLVESDVDIAVAKINNIKQTYL